MKVHLQVIEDYHFGYHAHENYYYICEDSCNLGLYLGHVFGIHKLSLYNNPIYSSH